MYTKNVNENENASTSKRGWSSKAMIAMALCCSLLGGGLGGMAARSGESGVVAAEGTLQVQAATLSTFSPSGSDQRQELSAADIYEANVNSTVGITTSEVTTNRWGQTTTNAAAGSGFIYTADGYIITNYHVIEGATTITVTLYNDSSYDATLVGYDESNDLAVLKIEASGLTPVVLGDSDCMRVGEQVIAIGNPLGELTFSMTSGSISALNRSVTLSASNGGSITMKLVQTDCAINSGNSGGALFNMYGEVIGITNAKYSSSSSGTSIDNIGFAIPINSVLDEIQSIIEKGTIDKPYIGVSASDVSAAMQQYGLPQGAAIQSVTEGSPADKAGLQANDIVTQINGESISTSQELVYAVKDCRQGDVLALSIYRQGEELTFSVQVELRQQNALPDQAEVADSQETLHGTQNSNMFVSPFVRWFGQM